MKYSHDEAVKEIAGSEDVLGACYTRFPKSEKTLLKYFDQYPVRLDNSFSPCEYEIYSGETRIGMIKYYKGRILACYETKSAA